ncbi:MAG: hypothetical protein ACX94A_08855 [Algiphilus sp.]
MDLALLALAETRFKRLLTEAAIAPTAADSRIQNGDAALRDADAVPVIK